MRRIILLVLGIAFGFVLANNGAADFGANRDMFLFRRFDLFGVGIVSVCLTAIGFAAIRRLNFDAVRCIRWTSRGIHRGSVWGGAIFGIGWGISGLCPATALVNLGRGHVIALATVVGIAIGIAVRNMVNRRYLRWVTPSCD